MPSMPNQPGPLITVVVPIFNMARHLEKCLDSAMAQTYRNLEIVLVDDGSTDRSLSICQDYKTQDARIQISSKPNGGLSSARNAGLALAHGKYIFFLDSDDFIEPDTLDYLLFLLETHGANIACCGVRLVKYGATVGDPGDGSVYLYEGDEIMNQYFHGKHLVRSVCNKLYSIDLIRRLGASFAEEIRFTEDDLFNCLVLPYAGRVVAGTLKKYNYVLHGQNMIMGVTRYRAHRLKALAKMHEVLKQKSPIFAPLMARFFILDAISIVSEIALEHAICTAPGCLDQTLASGSLLGEPGLSGFFGCASA